MLRRILFLIFKEFQIILGDKRTKLMLIVPVIMQTLIFPFAATLEVKNSTLAIYNQDEGVASKALIHRLSQATAFSRRVIMIHSDQALDRVIQLQQAHLVVCFPRDFSRKLLTQQTASVQVLVDGRRSNSGQIAASYVTQMVQSEGVERGGKSGTDVIVRHLYNPNLHFTWHVLPSLVAIITTVGCLMVTALSVAREREEGTFDQLLVTPLTAGYIMLGKAVPGVVVSAMQGSFIALVAFLGFGVPFTGSLPLLAVGMVLFGVALSGVGLFISSLSDTQQQAFLGVFTFMAPAVMLSGFVAPVENMPGFFQVLAYCNPLTYFICIIKGCFLKGWGFKEAWPSLWPLFAIAFVTLSLALRLFRRHIA